MTTIGLCMIVRDEASVIGRCLARLAPLVHRWTVVDTGSTDGTPDIVRTALAGVPGELHHRPWRDFATNRSEAFAMARPWTDYVLAVDADDVLEAPPGFAWPSLGADLYALDIRDTGAVYRRPQLLRTALPWRYRGVVHEFPVCEGAGPVEHLPGPVLLRGHDGARRRDPDTYRRDAALLERALAVEAEPMLRARYAFYLGNSWRDCGEASRAVEAYLARAAMGGWADEVFVSLLWCGRLMVGLGRPRDDALAVLERAAAADPARAEALHEAAMLCRRTGDYARAHGFALRAVGLPMPMDRLFVEPWSYTYGALDELAVAAFWTGRYRESLDAGLRALAGGAVPPAEQARVLHNMRAALDRLPS